MREAILALIAATSAARPAPETTLRVMTYNVHSCKGGDGEVRPERIAAIIAQHNPDVVALQEVRVGRVDAQRVDDPGRTEAGSVPPPVGEPPLPPPSVVAPRKATAKNGPEPFMDQPRQIAEAAGMYHVFYPLVRLRKEDYGIAVLSRYPMRVVRAGNLPTSPGRKAAEKRGAIWVEITVAGRDIQLFNTHLGLDRAERAAQMEALVGADWLGEARGRRPFILCGDLNSPSGARPYQLLSQAAIDVAVAAKTRGRRTFPSFLPLLRLDYIFISEGIRALGLETPRTRLTRASSDHLPVIADLALEKGI